MALGSLPTTSDTWSRWPQHHHAGAAYGMMEAGMVHYDCRSEAAGHIPRPELVQHYLPSTFGPAPMPSPSSPQYPSHLPYGGYNPYSSPPMLDSPFRSHECLDRLQPSVPPVEPPADEGIHDRMDGLRPVKRNRSPSIKSEAKPTALDSVSSPKSIAANMRVQGAPSHQSKTPIDKLVRVIEAKRGILDLFGKAEQGRTDEGMEGGDAQTQQGRGKAKRKRFCCDIPGCSKKFAQKNNLDTHRRSHTGESPYVCQFCSRRFTQSVNLKSHILRHLGERPYKCPQCPKAFSQPSNVKAHMKTHEKRELRARWVCRFGACKKAFTAKGNLKNHQNTYHLEDIETFEAKLAAVVDESMISEEDKEMARYLAEVHNLANKGIKGRGKGRKVKRVLLLHPVQHSPSSIITTSPTSASTTVHPATPYSMPLLPHHGLPTLHQQQQQQAVPQQPATMHHDHGHPFSGLSSPAAYSMSRPSPVAATSMLFGVSVGGINPRDMPTHSPYGLLDSDQVSDASSVHTSTPVMHVYEEEHGRELAFGDRLY